MKGNSSNSKLQIQLLGSFKVCVNDRVVDDSAWRRRHARQLIKILALDAHHSVHRDVLVEALWPESSPDKSANNLNKVIFIARRALEPDLAAGEKSSFLTRSGDFIKLSATGGLSVDTIDFTATATQALDSGNLELLRESANQFTGTLLTEDMFDDAFSLQRDTLQRLFQRVLLKLSEILTALGNYDEATDTLARLLEYDPLSEDLHLRQMLLYEKCDQKARAIAQFEMCRKILLAELGQSPGDRILALYRKIKSSTSVNPPIEPSTHDEYPSVKQSDVQSGTLAVMPFENATGKKELDYLCEGITEDLIVSLSRLQGQRVVARSTVFHYKGSLTDPAEIREILSAKYVVLGRINDHKGRVRVWVEFVETDNGAVQWAENYDKRLDDTLALQQELTTDIMTHLKTTLQGGEDGGLYVSPNRFAAQVSTKNEQAYHLYLKGRYHWNKRTGRSLEMALSYFQSAIDNDPVYAQAYSGLADTYNLLSLYTSASPHDTMPKARAAAHRALAIHPESSEAQTSLAYCQLSYDWDWKRAESGFRQALEIDPGYATARQWYHKLLVVTGRFSEAEKQIQTAKRLDPLSPMISTEEAWGLYHSRQYDRAVSYLQKITADDPNFAMAHFILGASYIQSSRLDLAIKCLKKAVEEQQDHNPFLLQIGVLGHAFAANGDITDAKVQLKRLVRLSEQAVGANYAMALVYAGLGEYQKTLDCLESAVEERVDRVIFLPVEPMFDGVRHHRRWDKLMGNLKSGLPGLDRNLSH